MAFFSRTFVATAVLAALTLPVMAQSTAPAEPAPAQSQAQTAKPGNPAMHRVPNRAKMQERMAQHQAALKKSLELSASQEPAWNAFIASMKPGERPARLGPLSREEAQKLTTPERVERMRAQRSQRQAQADLRMDAVLAFYAELNPAQQKTFDAHAGRNHQMGHWGELQNMRNDCNMGKKGRDGRNSRWEQRQNQAPATTTQ